LRNNIYYTIYMHVKCSGWFQAVAIADDDDAALKCNENIEMNLSSESNS